MNSDNFTIRDLIRFQLGLLNAGQCARIRKACTERPEAKRLLVKIRRGITYLETELPRNGSKEVTDEQLAIWLEGGAGSDVDFVETAARKNDLLLLQLIELLRSEQLAPRLEEVPQSLTNRLLNLGDSLQPPVQSGDEIPIVISFGAANVDKSVGSLIQISPSRKRNTRQFGWYWAVAGAILFLLGGLTTGIWWWRLQNDSDRNNGIAINERESTSGEDSKKGTPSHDDIRNEQTKDGLIADKLVEGLESPAVVETNESPSQSQIAKTEIIDQAPIEPKLPVQDRPRLADKTPMQPPNESSAGPEPTTNPVLEIPRLEWKTIKGLIAVRNSRTGETSGILAERVPAENDEWMTAPRSWGEAEFGNISTIVVDEDSAFSISLSAEQDWVDLSLRYGRVALKDLDDGTRVRLTAGEASWEVVVKAVKTTIGVEYVGEVPTIFQRSGESVIGGRTVKGRQQITSTTPPEGPQRLGLNLNWLTGPKIRSLNFDYDGLLATRDLGQALRELDTSRLRDPQAEFVLLETAFVIQPEFALEIINQPNPNRAQYAMNWLTKQVDSPRRGQVLRGLTARVGEEQSVLAALSAVRNPPNPQQLSVEQINETFRQLATADLFYRIAAFQYLMQVSGNSNPVNYSPHDPENVRIEKARQWRNLLFEPSRGGPARRN
jgi:hypothetical protein